MSGTGSDLALRDDAALAIQAGQTAWTPMQEAALNQIGLKDAPDGDRMVFLHQCERTGLDPFSKQIYMIPRSEKKSVNRGGRWEDEWSVKWTIQTGIEGWRTIRDRAERREGVRGKLSRFTYYDIEGKSYPVWVKPQPPVACEFTYTVIDRHGNETPYTSVLRFAEYIQLSKDGKPIAQWATKPVHMIEKCTESDSYRKAFPQDYSGIEMADAAPQGGVDWQNLSDEELNARYEALMQENRDYYASRRGRVTAGQAKGRAAQTVTAAVVTPEPSPAAPASPPPDAATITAPGAAAAGEARSYAENKDIIQQRLDELGVHEVADKLQAVSLIIGRPVKAANNLRPGEAAKAAGTLEAITEVSGAGLLADLAAAGAPEPGEADE